MRGWIILLTWDAILTYKAIRDAIKGQLGTGLFYLPPTLDGEEACRTVFVSREIRDIVMVPQDRSRDARRHAALRALLDAFTIGTEITIAENPHDKDRCAMLARIEPVSAEVWDFRCLDPKPGIRAFGRFSEPDIFVALTWNYRENIHPNNWAHEVTRCQDEWQRLVGYNSPHHGNTINAYLTCNWRPV